MKAGRLRRNLLSRTKGITSASAGSVADFVRLVSRIERAWRADALWFRGQGNSAHGLKPGTYRRPDRYRDEAEDERCYEFRRRAVQFPAGRPPTSDWEWYVLMQHHGLPTRLLDWSEGALIGLYFAVREHEGSHDAAVWILDPTWLQEEVVRRSGFLPPRRDPMRKFVLDYMPDPDDKRTDWILGYLPEMFSKKRLPAFPAPFRPPQIHRRVAAQLSAFTIHGRFHLGLEKLAHLTRDPRLAKIRVPASRIERIRKDLELCGIVETTVFPELEGLGRELRDF